MDPKLVIILIKIIVSVNSAIINNVVNNTVGDNNNNLDNVFNGVYVECFMHLSYLCIQRKTLMYLKELNTLSEVSVIGDYVKFVKLNTTVKEERQDDATNTEELAFMIDRAVDVFFENHVLKFNALGKDIIMPRNVEEFVGRKKRKGGGGGGGGHMSDDGGKKKMMMMAMMCMKMKLMMMVPAMMGMMGMMSFKGMMFSMMSFLMSKMMLLMKLLEKKGGGGGIGGGGGGGGDGGWIPGGGGGGAWMPAGGQDYGGGGYDANGQWQSRSIIDPVTQDIEHKLNKPTITYVTPIISYNNAKTNYKTPVLVYKKSNVNFEFDDPVNSIDHDDSKSVDSVRRKRDLIQKHYNIENDDNLNQEEIDEHRIIKDMKQNENLILNDPNWNLAMEDTDKPRTRIKRGLIDLLQNSYLYWMNQFLGLNNNRRTAFQKHKVVNGVKYVYYPYPFRVLKQKTPKDIRFSTDTKATDEVKPVIAAEDFNKGEIMEGGVQSRMHKKKLNKMKDTVDEALEDNPWE